MILQAKNICKSYDFPEQIQILQNVSLSLEHGEAIAIMGASGEGKTTFLHILGTLESYDAGELVICGEKTSSRENYLRNQKIGFIFQSYNLLEDCTAIENVLMPARIARHKIEEKRGLELLAMVGLEKKAIMPVRLMSGGEKQRVAIARAFCNNPNIIIADEPSGNLDNATSKIIHDLLLTCVKSGNKTLLLATHDSNLASLCDKTYLLSGGALQRTILY